MENTDKEKEKRDFHADLFRRVPLNEQEIKMDRTKQEPGIPIEKNISSRKITNQAAHKVSLQPTEETVRRKSFSDAMQHPATMLPAAICLISVGYLVLLEPMFGGGIPVMAIGAISGVAAGVSFRTNYLKVYQKNYRELKLSFDIAREQLEEEELKGLRDNVKAGFTNIGSLEGLAVLDHLSEQYDRLKASFSQQRTTDPLSVSIIPVLAEDTYRRGLGVLSDTLELMNVVLTPGKGKVEEDIARVDKQIKEIKNDASQAERLKLKEEVAASLIERLATINRLNLWIEQLLHQAQMCQDVLQTARIELATVRASSTKSGVISVIKVLEERIRQVKEVQEEVDKLGY